MCVPSQPCPNTLSVKMSPPPQAHQGDVAALNADDWCAELLCVCMLDLGGADRLGHDCECECGRFRMTSQLWRQTGTQLRLLADEFEASNLQSTSVYGRPFRAVTKALSALVNSCLRLL